MDAPWTFWTLLVVGFLVLGLETIALLRNRIIARSAPRHSAWSRIYRWRFLLGFLLGVASLFIWYPSVYPGDRFKVFGIPFVFMLFDQAGKDYVGSLTFPSFLADMIVWLLIPDLVLWLWARRVYASAAKA
jgi:hypothetical protein